MKDILVGSTGLVGSNLLLSHRFSLEVHSTNVHKAYGGCPNLCIYAGIPSEMFLANRNCDADLALIRNARENIRMIRPKKLVLISTVAVYSNCDSGDETSVINESSLTAYGRNRLKLESWIKEDYPDAQIVRLPAIYGNGLRKNFLYDLHHVIPRMLTVEKYERLNIDCSFIGDFYIKCENGYYCLKEKCANKKLKDFFMHYPFNALSFTDSRSRYQFYNLCNLWSDIQTLLETEISLINFVTPPLLAGDVYYAVTGKNDWVNELDTVPYNYNLKSIYMDTFKGYRGYLCSAEKEITDICCFMEEWNKNEIMY